MQATIIYMPTRLFAGVHGAAKQQAAGSRGAPILVGLVCRFVGGRMFVWGR